MKGLDISMEAAEEALAYCHITSLLSLYYQALDTANWDTLEKQVMADDAVWEVIQHSPSGTVRDLAEGRDAVLRWFKRMMGGEVTMSQGTVRHFINTHVIKIEGHTARSTSHLQAVDSGTLNIVANGFVEAEHTKVPEGWRIKRYKIDEHITDADMNAFKATLGLEFE
jgi:predicted SnoaL-like aldol condensation-catalyzing enzyme